MASTHTDSFAVLVVEDDSQLLRTLSDILRRRGYRALAAATGRQGVALAEQSPVPPAVALVDLRLPDMDGFEVISRLRSISELTETVVLTGHASLDSAVRALREHSCDYLVKPVAPDQLFPIVERAGERWHRRLAEEALRRSEERFRLLLENISDVIAVAEPNHTIRYVSPSVTHVLGYEPQDLIGRNGLVLAHEEDAPAVEALVQDVIATPGATGTVEVRARHRDGSWRTVELTTTNLMHRPEIAGLMYIARDVTERRQFETQVQQAQKMESIGSLAGGVAHDFNNVLSAIIGYGELIADSGCLDERGRTDLGEMLAAAHRGTALTRQLLAFSRQQAIEPRLINLNSLIENLLNMLGRLIGESIELVTELEPELGLVNADPSQFEQVLMNLAVNARDAMPDGGKLTIRTENVRIAGHQGAREAPQPGDYVRLTVRDSGSGMSESVKARAFEPFFTTKPMGKGTGLGLSTCYGIVRQASGYITIDSAPGHGTAIVAYLPRTQAAIERGEITQTRSPMKQAGQETILLVDDDNGVRSLLTRVLTAAGYRIFDAADPQEALDILREQPGAIQLLLTDVGLPRMNGFRLAEQMRSQSPNLKVLFMSGYDAEAASAERFAASASIQKPFTPREILEKVRVILDQPGEAVASMC